MQRNIYKKQQYSKRWKLLMMSFKSYDKQEEKTPKANTTLKVKTKTKTKLRSARPNKSLRLLIKPKKKKKKVY